MQHIIRGGEEDDGDELMKDVMRITQDISADTLFQQICRTMRIKMRYSKKKCVSSII